MKNKHSSVFLQLSKQSLGVKMPSTMPTRLWRSIHIAHSPSTKQPISGELMLQLVATNIITNKRKIFIASFTSEVFSHNCIFDLSYLSNNKYEIILPIISVLCLLKQLKNQIAFSHRVAYANYIF